MSKPSDDSSIIRRSDCLSVPWKNGMGTTQEIAVQPSESHTDHFLWRVSVAEVNSAAPFSSFPGIDRHIVLLEGGGFIMTLDDDRKHALDTPFVPFAFAGESAVAVTLVDGATRDFNLMVRRAEAWGDVVVMAEPGTYRLEPDVVLVYAARAEIDTAVGVLHAGDTWRNGSGRSQVTLRDGAVALAIRIRPKA